MVKTMAMKFWFTLGKLWYCTINFLENWYCIETYELKQNYGSIPKTINVQVNFLIARLFQSKDNIWKVLIKVMTLKDKWVDKNFRMLLCLRLMQTKPHESTWQ